MNNFNNFNQINSYSSTIEQQSKENSQTINDKINNIQNNGFFKQYNYSTLFENFPVNTRLGENIRGNNKEILSGTKMIPGCSIDSSEFIYDQYKNSNNSKNIDYKKQVDINNLNNQFNNNISSLENDYSYTIKNQYNTSDNIVIENKLESSKIDSKNSSNKRLQELGPLASTHSMPINNNKIYDNKHSYPINTRYS